MHETIKHFDDTVEALNATIKHILREADDEPLDDEKQEELERCWRIMKDAVKVKHMAHEHKAHAVGGATMRA